MSFNLKLFFAFSIFGIFLALFSVYSFSKVSHKNQLDAKFEETEALLLQKEKQVSNYIKRLDQTLISLSNNPEFNRYIKNGSHKEFMNGLFKTIITSKEGLLKVSYIDHNGKGLIEVNSSMDNVINDIYTEQINTIILKKTRAQKKGEIWHSSFGLYIKGTKLEKNKESIFIITIKLKHGVLFFTVSVDEILNIIKNHHYKIFLIDKDSNIITNSQKKYSWSEYLKKNARELRSLNQKDYKFLEKDFVKTDKYISTKLKVKNEDESVLVLTYPDFRSIIDDKMYYVYISILMSTILLAIILAYIFSKPMAKMIVKIERLNNKLDRKVEQRTRKLKNSLRVIDKYVIRSVTDTDGIILSVSDAFCEVSKYTKEELIGQSHSIVRHPDMDDKIFKNMWITIKSGKSWNGKMKNLAKDGSNYWVNANIEPNFVNNKIVSYTAIRTKISNKVKLEELNKSLEKRIKEEVQKSTEQLKLIQDEQLKNAKLNSIGTLAAGITHEINTPLTYIKGNFELMKYDFEELPASEIRNRILEDSKVITNGIQRISNIVEAMKEVSSKSSEIVENINIYNTLITALTLSFSNTKQVSKIYINGELFDIGIDKNKLEFNALVQKQRIEQVWIIIINNAIDELVKVDFYENRCLNINIAKIEDKIVVEFIDNAGGIKEKILKKIFEPFISTKERGGMGIGLNVAKNIINEHSGTITAKNIKNGAKFTIELYAEGAKC